MCEVSALVMKSKGIFTCSLNRRTQSQELSRTPKATCHKGTDSRIKYIFYNLSMVIKYLYGILS